MFNFISLNFNILSKDFRWKFWKREIYTKENIKILFIDDSDMPVVNSLRSNGYNVKKIQDIKNIDDPVLKDSQIVFIDFHGVGLRISPEHQGAGLIKEIRNQYGLKKYLIFYTNKTNLPTETTLHDLFNMADAKLRKDSDNIDFIQQIRKGINELNKR
jgi:hypothetical protein